MKIRTTLPLLALALSLVAGTASADVSSVRLTSSDKMLNRVDNGRGELRVRYTGRPLKAGEYCYLALDQGGPRGWNRLRGQYTCETTVPYSLIDGVYGGSYGYRVLAFVGRYGSAPSQKGWTSFKTVRR